MRAISFFIAPPSSPPTGVERGLRFALQLNLAFHSIIWRSHSMTSANTRSSPLKRSGFCSPTPRCRSDLFQISGDFFADHHVGSAVFKLLRRRSVDPLRVRGRLHREIQLFDLLLLPRQAPVRRSAPRATAISAFNLLDLLRDVGVSLTKATSSGCPTTALELLIVFLRLRSWRGA